MSLPTHTHDIDDLTIEHVDDDGTVVVRMPSGHRFRLAVPTSMVPYYRRLVPEPHYVE